MPRTSHLFWFTVWTLTNSVISLEFCKNGHFHPNCVPKNCTFDDECHQASPGPYSRCRIEFAQCECFHNNRYGSQVNNTCLPVKNYGDVCTSDGDCKSIRGQSGCLGLTSTYGIRRGICGCLHLRDLYHSERNECLKLQNTEGSPCHVDIQCSHVRALGSLSKCDVRSSICKCWDTVGGGVDRVGWHGGKCYFSRGQGDSCDVREECVIGFHPNADCLEDGSYQNETVTVCQCPENERCEEEPQKEASRYSASSSIKQSLELIFLVTIFTISAFEH